MKKLKLKFKQEWSLDKFYPEGSVVEAYETENYHYYFLFNNQSYYVIAKDIVEVIEEITNINQQTENKTSSLISSIGTKPLKITIDF